MKNKQIILIVGVIALLVGGAVYWSSKRFSVEPKMTSRSPTILERNILNTPSPSPQSKPIQQRPLRVNPSPVSSQSRERIVSTATLGERLLSADPAVSDPAQSEIPNLSEDQKKQLAFSILETVKNVNDPVLQTSIANKAGPVLVHLGPAAFPALIQGLGDAVAVIRMKSAYALGEFGAFAKEAFSPLMKNAIKDTDVFARCDAIDALGKMGPEARDAVPALVTSLGDPNKIVRFHVVQALGNIGPDASQAVPLLTSILDQDRDIFTRAAAAKSLGQMGRPASTAVPELIAASKENDQRLREAASTALREISESSGNTSR